MRTVGGAVHTVPSSSVGELVGIQNIQKITSPAAGAEWTYTLPGGFYYRILSITATFVTSAAVANRNAGIRFTDGQNLLYQISNSNNIVASTTCVIEYSTVPSTQFVATAKGAVSVQVLPVWLTGNYVISSVTSAEDVADQYSSIILWVEQLDFGLFGQKMLRHEPSIYEHEITGLPVLSG